MQFRRLHRYPARQARHQTRPCRHLVHRDAGLLYLSITPSPDAYTVEAVHDASQLQEAYTVGWPTQPWTGRVFRGVKIVARSHGVEALCCSYYTPACGESALPTTPTVTNHMSTGVHQEQPPTSSASERCNAHVLFSRRLAGGSRSAAELGGQALT